MSEQHQHEYDQAMRNVHKFHTPKSDAAAAVAHQALVKDGEASQIKAKYRSAQSSKYAGGERAADKKHRNKIGSLKHNEKFGEPKAMTLVVDGRTGKSVMRAA